MEGQRLQEGTHRLDVHSTAAGCTNEHHSFGAHGVCQRIKFLLVLIPAWSECILTVTCQVQAPAHVGDLNRDAMERRSMCLAVWQGAHGEHAVCCSSVHIKYTPQGSPVLAGGHHAEGTRRWSQAAAPTAAASERCSRRSQRPAQFYSRYCRMSCPPARSAADCGHCWRVVSQEPHSLPSGVLSFLRMVVWQQ